MIDIHQHVATDVEGQLRRAGRAGADRVVLLPTAVHPEDARSLADVREEFARLTDVVAGRGPSPEDANAEVEAALRAHPAALAMVKPDPSDTSEELGAFVEKALRDRQIVGLGELTPPPGGGAGIEPVVRASAQTSDETPLPVLVHGFYPNDADDIRAYAEITARYPRVPLILGAFGGLNSMLAIELAIERPNLYLDLSSALQTFLVGAALREIPDQCLFGSNTPYGDVVASRAAVEAAAPDAHALRMALRENAVRIFDLDSSELKTGTGPTPEAASTRTARIELSAPEASKGSPRLGGSAEAGQAAPERSRVDPLAGPEAVLDRYFALSDTAGGCESDFDELVGLFGENARIEPNAGKPVTGGAVREFFRTFFARNIELHHVWTTSSSREGTVAEWAVCGRRADGTVFALSGRDVATFDPTGRIATLRVQAN